MSEEAKQCIVGLFDILGYQNFLENNSVTNAAHDVLVKLQGIRTTVDAELTSYGVSLVQTPIEWLIFSDTILLLTDYPDDLSVVTQYNRWSSFLSTCNFLNSSMVSYGLPIRGAIDFGKVLVLQHCFAGRPIVRAFQLASDLDMAAIAISPEAQSSIEQVKQKSETAVVAPNPKEPSTPFRETVKHVLDLMTIKYLAPRKSGIQERLLMVNIGRIEPTPFDYYAVPDVRQKLLECFLSHNKDMSPGAKTKLDNTELFVRACLSHTIKTLKAAKAKTSPPP